MRHRPASTALLYASLLLASQGWVMARDLTFEDRVKAQEAIERVYYSHQMGTTKPFEEAVPHDLLVRKVRTYLKQTVALQAIWQTTLTSEALQHELQRIARSSHTPGRLEELFQALGHDGFLIQECFVRPVLVNRLARNFFSTDTRFHGESKRRAEDLRKRLLRNPRTAPGQGIDLRVVDVIRGEERSSKSDMEHGVLKLRVGQSEFERIRSSAPQRAGEVGRLVETPESFDIQVLLETSQDSLRLAAYAVEKTRWDDWWNGASQGLDEFAVESVAQTLGTPAVENLGASASSGGNCVEDDTWVSEGLDDPPIQGRGHVAVWTGNEMLVWGGIFQNSAARYDPVTDTWGRLSTKNAPPAGSPSPAVWTGSEMIVWGGSESLEGGRYDPRSDTWRPISTIGAPTASGGPTLIWTGTTMIVWGARQTMTGGRYDPATDTWRPTSTLGAPDPRSDFSALWSGTEMIVWGGYDGASYLSSGARYDPVADTWRSTAALGAPSPRAFHTAVWADDLMIVWGGYDGNSAAPLATGARYDPQSDTWTPTSGSNAPSGRYAHTANWTGHEMLIWGGQGIGRQNSGARYDPSSDVWTSITVTNAPSPRVNHTAVWTGRLLLVWGGVVDGGISESGGRYDPLTDSWTPTATSNRPTPRLGHSAVWTGSRMIVWGGLASLNSLFNTGGSYDPLTASWTAISSLNAPSRRSDHVAIWTGSVMVVWGGVAGEDRGGTGGRYDPVADSWSPTSTAGAPRWTVYRKGASAVWTGTEMIVWGGVDSGERYFGDGGRYDPAADTWVPTSPTGAPIARVYHAAVWTGNTMLVWGGFRHSLGGPYTYFDDGYAYLPTTDSWSQLSRLGAPSPREHHAALWTGEQMLIWGGDGPNGILGDGAAYDAQTDTWAAISGEGAPQFFTQNTAVWSDPVMIVWGSSNYGAVSGGRYDATTNAWKPVSDRGAPAWRTNQSAVWTGEEMIVWGGDQQGAPLDTGGAYRVDLSPDTDHDGYTVCAGDCDDANPDVHPGAGELCNGQDDDCNGQIDDGFLVGTGCVSDLDSCHQLVGALSCKADGTGTQCAGVVTFHDLTAPAIVCPADVNLECPAGAANIGQATAADACDPTPIITNNASPIIPLGAMVVDWTATDASGNRASCPELVNVRDTTSPRIAVVTSPSVLWPPNHRMMDVSASVAASDACGTTAVSLVSVNSTEPDDSPGTGDGNTVNDIQGPVPGSGGFNFALRAERDGGGGGRVYQVTYSAVDGSGNRSIATSFVFVPHDEAGVTEPLLLSVEDGPAGTSLMWDPVPGALSYRVVRGRIGSLREAGDFIDLGTVACVQPPSTATSTQGHEDAENPPAGEAFFYVAAYNDGRDSGYGTVSAGKPRVVTGGGCE
ncbi:MAG: hypothetical protein AUG09_05670 [Acidobacteria bacterium 13_1_20CM_2_68_7]|nr:MAG: hypothetical protein AUG09_05670 [Acidobacteria bacterium 13_1_20CM_2_68_7]